MPFSAVCGKTDLQLKHLEAILRDITVSMADKLRVPVDALSVRLQSSQHALDWTWCLTIDTLHGPRQYHGSTLQAAYDDAKRGLANGDADL